MKQDECDQTTTINNAQEYIKQEMLNLWEVLIL